MKITNALLGEHGVFYAQFAFIEDALPSANVETVQSLGALLAAGLASHAHIENEIFFPAIEAKIGAGGPTMVMRADHVDIDGALTRLPQARDAAQARELLRNALDHAREHFSKEENVLFPMAEQMLDDSTLEQLGAQWSARRGVVLV